VVGQRFGGCSEGMDVNYSVLGSGSSGNCSFLQDQTTGLLIDCGFGPRTLAVRLAAVGFTWHDVTDVLLTHTHGDHWKETTFAYLFKRRVTLHLHRQHLSRLLNYSPAIKALHDAGLTQCYQPEKRHFLDVSFSFSPFDVSHDSGRTFGFRLESPKDLFSSGWSLGYACDLGCWTPEIAGQLVGCEILAIEFNHDQAMQRNSPRPERLIRRVLSDQGHLSNGQAAQLLSQVLSVDSPSTKAVVQLHLSQQCNQILLARQAAQQVIAQHGNHQQLFTAQQATPINISHPRSLANER